MKQIRNEFKAGLFIVVCVALFALSIFVMGRERQIFVSQLQYRVAFRDVKGLNVGAPIRLGGITIGRVADISFPENVFDPNIQVTLLVNEPFKERIREDSEVVIETQGLLGDRFLNVTTGVAPRALEPGSTLNAKESTDIGQVVTKLEEIVGTTSSAMKSVEEILTRFKGEGLSDTLQSLASIKRLTREIEEGEGVAHRVIYSEDLGKDISSAASDLSKMTHQVRSGDGLLHALVYGDGGKKMVATLGKTVETVSAAALAAHEIFHEVRTGNGFLHEAVFGGTPKELNEMIVRLNKASESINNAALALANGSGTLGALLVDSSLYDNLVEVTDGAKRSFLLRQAIRSSLDE